MIKETYKKTLTEARITVKKTRAVNTGDAKKDGEGDGPSPNADQPSQELWNDKLYLAEALLKQGAWKQAQEVMDRLPQYHATSHQPVAQTMCQLIHYVIDPMYQRYVVLTQCTRGLYPLVLPVSPPVLISQLPTVLIHHCVLYITSRY